MRVAWLTLAFPVLIGAGTANTSAPTKPIDSDHPTVGILTDVKDSSSLRYACSSEDEKVLHCDFYQVAFRKVLTQDQYAAYVKREFADATKGNPDRTDTKACQPLPDTMKEVENSPNLNERERTRALALIRRTLDICRDPSDQNVLALVREEADQALKTCKVYSSTYSQDFTKVSTSTWVADRQKQAADLLGSICGAMYPDRFEKDTKDSSQYITHWDFYIRTVVSNPSQMLLNSECRKFEEDRELDSNRTVLSIDCDTFDFLP
jgi:hypothetical protein